MHETVVMPVGLKMIERRKRATGDNGVDEETKLPVQVNRNEHTQNAISRTTHATQCFVLAQMPWSHNTVVFVNSGHLS